MPRTKTTERESIPFQTRQELFMTCRGRCPHCGRTLSLRSDDCTIEHVIPINKGGDNGLGNLIILCKNCNKEKSDDIIPPEIYYPYLSESRRATLQAAFEEYLATYDYLAYDSLFPTDWFDLRIQVPVFPRNGGKAHLVPATVQIRKTRPWHAIEWLFEYMAHLHTRDKTIIATEEHQLATPYYTLYHQDKPLALLSPYIMKTTAQTAIREQGTERNVLFLDLFVNPNLPMIQGRVDFVLSAIYELESTIQRGLRDHSPDTIIEYVIRTPGSDRPSNAILERMRQVTPNRVAFVAESEDGAEIHCLDAIFFQGSKADIRRVGDQLGLEEAPGKIPVISVDKLAEAQRPLDAVLEHSREISYWEPPKPMTKKEKKSRHKKPKYRK